MASERNFFHFSNVRKDVWSLPKKIRKDLRKNWVPGLVKKKNDIHILFEGLCFSMCLLELLDTI